MTRPVLTAVQASVAVLALAIAALFGWPIPGWIQPLVIVLLLATICQFTLDSI